MNKKLLALVGVMALGLGSIGAIALQSYAQNTSNQSTTSAPEAVSAPQQENTATDADNIQNDQGGIEKPDVVSSQATDKETNDDKGVISTVQQADSKESGEGTAADTSEIEDGN